MRTERGLVRIGTAVLFAALLHLAATPCAAAGAPADKEQVESRLAGVLAEIDRLQQRLEAERGRHAEEQDRLRELDLRIQKASLRFRELEKTRRAHEKELQSLEQKRAACRNSLGRQLEQLAEQVRNSYRMGRQSRLKLVLNQDDPARLGRLLAYYEYFSRARAVKIESLKTALGTLEEMQQSIDQELSRIADVQKQQQSVLDDLEGQRAQRTEVLARLASKIGSGESRLRELEANRRDLEVLLERLADVLADIPADLGSHAGLLQQRGQLQMPVTGPVRHAFGQRRGPGLHWQGWLIGAKPGTEVRAIAYGRVAFADWLRGYGLLIIIDHGQDFMSLYGHNESLLREVGAWVEGGEPIGMVGSNPGGEQGLYFELRRKGRSIDPSGWLKRQTP